MEEPALSQRAPPMKKGKGRALRVSSDGSDESAEEAVVGSKRDHPGTSSQVVTVKRVKTSSQGKGTGGLDLSGHAFDEDLTIPESLVPRVRGKVRKYDLPLGVLAN